jgi:phage/plasmid-like protein (TIGR03299 family)
MGRSIRPASKNIMGHNLAINPQTNDHSFFSRKEKAWHGLGTIVDEYLSSAEALRTAGLDWTVEKWPMFAYDPEGRTSDEQHVPEKFATVRTDNYTVLGTVGKDYEIVQNVDAFSFFDSIVGGEGIMYETAGALGKGERIFITAKLPGYIRVGQDDCIEKYLFLTTSHDGLGSITAAFTPIRIVCNNTLTAAMRNHVNAIKIRHTANAKERLSIAHKLMGISNTMSDELSGIFNQWSKVRITDIEVKNLIQIAMVPNKETLDNLLKSKEDELSTVYTNMVDKVYEYAMSAPSQQQETTAGTLFGAYNAVTGYFQNVRNYRDGEAKLKSIMDGTGKLRAQSAFDLCTDFAKTQQLNHFIIN